MQREKEIGMKDIKKILSEALKKRCVFHSEADFQHHLAWYIHEQSSGKVRLEHSLSPGQYCDIKVKKIIEKGIK